MHTSYCDKLLSVALCSSFWSLDDFVSVAEWIVRRSVDGYVAGSAPLAGFKTFISITFLSFDVFVSVANLYGG